MIRRPPRSPLFPSPPLSRSRKGVPPLRMIAKGYGASGYIAPNNTAAGRAQNRRVELQDRKSTRLNSSHGYISYAVFCLKKKKKNSTNDKYYEMSVTV